MIAKIEDHIVDITKNIHKNVYVGKFINISSAPILYGDTINEVISQVEEFIRKYNKEYGK